jgi:hypothetical protein
LSLFTDFLENPAFIQLKEQRKHKLSTKSTSGKNICPNLKVAKNESKSFQTIFGTTTLVPNIEIYKATSQSNITIDVKKKKGGGNPHSRVPTWSHMCVHNVTTLH